MKFTHYLFLLWFVICQKRKKLKEIILSTSYPAVIENFFHEQHYSSYIYSRYINLILITFYIWPYLDLSRHAAGGKCASACASCFQFIRDRPIFPPMRAQVFTNKHCDWLELLEGGIFQRKSQWNLQPESIKSPKLEQRRGNLWILPSK